MTQIFTVVDIVKFVITIISMVDFLVFTVFFLVFMHAISYKAPDFKTKLMSVIIIVLFLVIKTIHVPVFFATMTFVDVKIPFADYMLKGLTYLNLVLAGVPLVCAIYYVFIKGNPTAEQIAKHKDKQIMIVMAIYNEQPDALWNAIQSVKDLDYNLSKVHCYLAFDDDKEPDAWKHLMTKYDLEAVRDKKIIVIEEEGLRLSICRFPHGGKKSAQRGAFLQMEEDYSREILDDSLIFLIDSDIVLQPDSLAHFVYYLEKNKKNCATGLITCISSDTYTFLKFYQDVEYISGQVFWRNMENSFGATTCLPGAFTILRYTTLKKVCDRYFESKIHNDNFDYHRFYLGEDRYLTHILMEEEDRKIGFCEAARCKTHAPDTLQGLLKQRKRWQLGHISNDTWMMSSLVLWKKYPLLSLFNFLNNTRNSSIYIYLLYFVLIFNQEVPILLWVLFVILPLALNWIFIVIYSLCIRRRMNMLFYIVILLIQPVFAMVYMYYTISKIRERSWGGARVDQRKRDDDEPIVERQKVKVDVENVPEMIEIVIS